MCVVGLLETHPAILKGVKRVNLDAKSKNRVEDTRGVKGKKKSKEDSESGGGGVFQSLDIWYQCFFFFPLHFELERIIDCPLLLSWFNCSSYFFFLPEGSINTQAVTIVGEVEDVEGTVYTIRG